MLSFTLRKAANNSPFKNNNQMERIHIMRKRDLRQSRLNKLMLQEHLLNALISDRQEKNEGYLYLYNQLANIKNEKKSILEDRKCRI